MAGGSTPEGPASGRLVEVAVDVPGQGGDRTYTYAVPPALGDLAAGEAVLVEYGRRQAIGIVLGDAGAPEGVTVKAVAARVRTDGPLLPPLQLALVRAVARHYLAPPALVARAALPPGLLERLELVALANVGTTEVGEADAAALGPVLARIAAAGAAGIPVRHLPWTGGRAALIRELRAREASGSIRLEWRLTEPGAGVRLERRAALTAEGRAVAGAVGPAGGTDTADVRATAEGRAVAGAVGPAGGTDTADVPATTDGGGPADRAPGDARAAVAAPAADARAPARPRLGVRQRDVLAALVLIPPGETLPAARLAEVHGASALSGLARRGLVDLTVAERPRRPLAGRPAGLRGPAPRKAALSPAQSAATEAISSAAVRRRFAPFLLDGVTGAGRTAVYAAAIEAALGQGRGALVLVPEIALATPLVDRLRAGLDVDIALVHGGLSEGERADEWRRIRAGEVRVVVGTRTAVLAPLADPGVVIVDEEHESAYKSDRTPRFQARDVALELGRLADIPVVLGSATPDVATLGRALAGEIERLPMVDRASGALPAVVVVDLRAELAAGNRGLLSRALSEALSALDVPAGDRAILVINRRGSASVVLCRDCGYVQVCPECRRPLVYHAAAAALRCHHCGATAPLATRCPACGSPRIRYLGGGTERLEREVRERFPRLRVARLDRDVLGRRGAAEEVLDGLRDGRIDVLVGTGLVAKGIDVPEVTLVGVVSADVALNLPDVRATERTYQLLAQAVGRAGRGERQGRAFIQTYQPENPAVAAVASGDPTRFYESELAARRAFGLPPYGRLVKLTVALEDRDAAEAEAQRMATMLRERAPTAGRPAPPEVSARVAALPGSSLVHEVLGPVPAYVARRAGRWRFHLVVRGPDPVSVIERDPGPPWSVDVDPESLL
jgi:primosomal protein N' (replication factor Y)